MNRIILLSLVLPGLTNCGPSAREAAGAERIHVLDSINAAKAEQTIDSLKKANEALKALLVTPDDQKQKNEEEARRLADSLAAAIQNSINANK